MVDAGWYYGRQPGFVILLKFYSNSKLFVMHSRSKSVHLEITNICSFFLISSITWRIHLWYQNASGNKIAMVFACYIWSLLIQGEIDTSRDNLTALTGILQSYLKSDRAWKLPKYCLCLLLIWKWFNVVSSLKLVIYLATQKVLCILYIYIQKTIRPFWM